MQSAGARPDADGRTGELRARELARLQAELERQERMNDPGSSNPSGSSSAIIPASEQHRSKPRRRASNTSGTSQQRQYATQRSSSQYPASLSGRPNVMDRQMSSGAMSVGGGGGGIVNNNSSSSLRERRSTRAPSNASRTSTVMSDGRGTKHKEGRVEMPRSSSSRTLLSPDWPSSASFPSGRRGDQHSKSNSSNVHEVAVHDSPLRRWCRFVEKTTKRVSSSSTTEKTKEWGIALAIIVWIKWTVGLGGWSGKGHPPLFGDLEAQRNWLSLTLHLPVSRWYYHNPYHWGLDYPPLTAYHSLLLATIAKWTGNAQVAELRGRLGGREDVHGEEKAILFMRSTVIVGDLLLWALPVALWLAITMGRWSVSGRGGAKRSSRTCMLAFYTIMLQPSLILIDSGHFQYNSIMLGLTLCAMIAMARGHDCLGAAFFVLSMGFKQMALYYAPAIFAYLLGKCFFLGGSDGLNLFTSLGFFSLATLGAVFSPFLYPPSSLFHALQRIFPFSRGLFEDKVANVWCSLNVVIKLREVFSMTALARISAALTLATTMPLIAGLVWVSYRQKADQQQSLPSTRTRGPAPTIKLLPHALFASAMAFFLFSFQVHEKSILLPLMPLTLILAGKQPDLPGRDYEWAVLLNNMGAFSMYPLLKRDGLALPTFALTLFWNFSIGYNPVGLKPSFVKYLSLGSYFVASAILSLDTVATPPSHLPDMFVVLNVVLSCGVFGLGWLWSLIRLVEEAWSLVGLHSHAENAARSPSGISAGSRELSPVSEVTDKSPTDLVGGTAENDRYLHQKDRRQQQHRSTSVASSTRSTTSTTKPRRSPLHTTAEEGGFLHGEEAGQDFFLLPPAYSNHGQPQASMGPGVFTKGDSSNRGGRLSPSLSPRLGDLSTHVSPSKTLVPDDSSRTNKWADMGGFPADIAREAEAYRASSMSEFMR